MKFDRGWIANFMQVVLLYGVLQQRLRVVVHVNVRALARVLVRVFWNKHCAFAHVFAYVLLHVIAHVILAVFGHVHEEVTRLMNRRAINRGGILSAKVWQECVRACD